MVNTRYPTSKSLRYQVISVSIEIKIVVQLYSVALGFVYIPNSVGGNDVFEVALIGIICLNCSLVAYREIRATDK